MHEQIPLIIFLLIMATECVRIQNCPSGSLEAVENTADFSLTCVEYTGTASWAFRLPRDTGTTPIGACGSTCTVNTELSSLLSLTRLSDSASSLGMTSKATTMSHPQVTYTCGTASCTVNIVESATPTTGVRIQNCPSGSMEALENSTDFSLTCSEYNGTADWAYRLPRDTGTTAIGTCGSACTMNPGLSSFFSLTRLSDSSSRLGITSNITTLSYPQVIYTCEAASCTVNSVVPTTQTVSTTPWADTANTSSTTKNSGIGPGSNALLIVVGSLAGVLPVVDACAMVAICKRRGRNVTTSAPIQDPRLEAHLASTIGMSSEAEGTDTGQHNREIV